MNTLADMLSRHTAAAAPNVAADHLRDDLWARLTTAGWQPQADGMRAPATKHTSDAALLQQFVQGDADAFELLFTRHLGPLLGFAHKQVPHEVAEELAQEAFVALLKQADTIATKATPASPPNVRAFLFAVLRNKIADHQRRAYRQLPVDPAEQLNTQPDAHAEQTITQLIAAYDIARIAELAVAYCTVLEQQVLALLAEGQANIDIAATLDLTAGHVGKLKHTVLRKLRAALQQAEPGARS